MDNSREMTKEELDMTKIQKIGADGKMHDYWQYTPEEIAVMKQKAEERRRQKEESKLAEEQ